MTTEDERLGLLLRTIRGRAELTQKEIAAQAGVPVIDLRLVEHGRAGEVKLDRTRRLFSAAGGRAKLTAWWNGAAADRLLDERHAGIVEQVVTVVQRRGWLTRVEVTFSNFGERGSIDVFAAHPEYRAVAVFEIKSDIGSLEETNRVLDVKERLAPILAVPSSAGDRRSLGASWSCPRTSRCAGSSLGMVRPCARSTRPAAGTYGPGSGSPTGS